MISKLKSIIKTPEVSFLCYPEDEGVIPPPIPARKCLPDWFKNLPPKIDNQNKLESSTIKRCMPVLDAFSAGWIIPLAADVEFVTDEAGGLQSKSKFYRTMVETHSKSQIAGHPQLPLHPFKFLNWWAIKMPPGYSMLFVPPLNRYEDRFQCFSGVVDDTYLGTDGFEFVNFPFFFLRPNYTGIIKAGTALVQAIPIKRDAVLSSSKTVKTGSLSQKDLKQIDHTRKRRQSHESLYRDHLRQPK